MSKVQKALQILTARNVPVRVRRELLRLHLPEAALRSDEYRFDLGKGPVFLLKQTLGPDRDTFEEIFIEGEYSTDYERAVVLDLGAHKGYFGAYALSQGALAVVSYEPEPLNHSLLERVADEHRRRGSTWTVHHAAIGSDDGEVELHVSSSSWSHSILDRPNKGSRRTLGSVRVPVVSLARAIAELDRSQATRLIVKTDVEGAECDVVLGTPLDVWRSVDDLLIEFHSFAPCAPDAMLAHLAEAGLEVLTGGETSHLVRTRPSSTHGSLPA